MATFVRPKSTSYLLPNSPSLSTAASITRSCLSHGTVLNPNFFLSKPRPSTHKRKEKKIKSRWQKRLLSNFRLQLLRESLRFNDCSPFCEKIAAIFFQLLIQDSKLPLTQVALRVVTPTYYALSKPTSQIIFSTIVPHFVRKSLQIFLQLLIQHSKLPLTQVALRVVTPTYYALS